MESLRQKLSKIPKMLRFFSLPPPPPEEPPPPLPGDEPGAIDEEDIAPKSESSKDDAKSPEPIEFHKAPEYHAGLYPPVSPSAAEH